METFGEGVSETFEDHRLELEGRIGGGAGVSKVFERGKPVPEEEEGTETKVDSGSDEYVGAGDCERIVSLPS